MTPGEAPYVVKPLTTGRHTSFHVYDIARGSYPAMIPGFGVVKQGHPTEQEAQTEADRLTTFKRSSR